MFSTYRFRVMTDSGRPLLQPSRRQLLVAGLSTASVLLLAGCSAPAADEARNVVTPKATPTPQKPVLSAVSPAQASVVGQQVTITGTGLADVTQVSFGTVTVPVTSANATTVVVAAPAASNYQPATVDVTLLGHDGAALAAKPQALQYVVSAGVGAQMQYALQHWNNYNTAEYGDLNPVGGDCANFVSQTLVARGWTMNDEWYNHNAAAQWGAPWGYVPAMDAYFADSADELGLEKLSFSQADRAKLALGDVGIFYWGDDTVEDHTEVVDKIELVNGQYKISLASHNDDFAYRDLDETITVTHPGSTGHFWHLTR